MRVVVILVLIPAVFFGCFFVLWGPEGCTVEGAKLAHVATDSEVLTNSIKTYVINAGRPPSTEQGLKALVEEPKTGPKPRRWTKVMMKVPTDSWGNPYRYRLLSEEVGRWRFELISAGKDGVFETADDWAEVTDLSRR